MKPDQFAYINNHYGLAIKAHSRVTETSTGKSGQVTTADGAYIFIQWDGEARPKGPYHPTDGLQYP